MNSFPGSLTKMGNYGFIVAGLCDISRGSAPGAAIAGSEIIKPEGTVE